MSDDLIHAIIADFAEHLVPEAFAAPSRARRISLEPVDLTDAADDRDAAVWFDRWLEARLEDALAATWPHDRPLAVAYVSDGRLLRRYDEPGCGHLDCLTAIVHDDVAAIDTPWLLACYLPRPQPTVSTAFDEVTGSLEEVLVPPGHTDWQAWWYAEARGRGVAATRAGRLDMDGERVVAGRRLEPRESRVGRECHRILYRHPSRRHHPLRGRRPRAA